MSKKLKLIKTTDEKIEDLAVMVQKGFEQTTTKEELKIGLKEVADRLDRIEFHGNSHGRRIDILEDKMQIVSTKLGLHGK